MAEEGSNVKIEWVKTVVFTLLLTTITGCQAKYTPTWESIDSRPLPQWYDNGKIGICVYLGIYSVPAVGNEWFWHNWKTAKIDKNVKYMKDNFKPNFTYADFAPKLTMEFFNPDQWMDLFEKSGAKYVLMTTKHHEGFGNWPSKYSYSWNSMDVGPNRDLVGEFAAAVRKKKDMKFGVYYSLYEWYNPLYMEDEANNYTTDRFVKFKTMPMLYELIETYKPELLWSDGDWLVDDFYWDSLSFLTWLYNDSPVKDTVVTNDRWGKNCNCKHGGYLTCKDRYNPGVLQKRKWENVMFIDQYSSSFRRDAKLVDFLTMEELLKLLAMTVSCGGNMLIDVGATPDGRIQPILEERLLSLGEWLKVNGEAIYESKPWAFQNDTYNSDVWYTMKNDAVPAVYAIVLKWPGQVLSLEAPVPHHDTTVVELLGYEGTFQWSLREEGGINIDIPAIPFNKMPCMWTWVFKLTGLKNLDDSSRVDDVLRFKPQN